MLKLATLLTLFVRASAQNYETGDNSTVEGCSSHCSPFDSDLACLNQTLQFYERLLLAQMRHFVAVQINIDQWYKRHMKHYHRNYTEIKEEEIAKLTADLEPDDVIDEHTINAVVSALIDRVEEESEALETRVPHFNCPLPCEYRYTMWREVFIASAVLNVLLVLAVIPFIISVIRSDVPEPLVRR